MILLICNDREPLETPIVRLICEKFNRELWSMNTEMGEYMAIFYFLLEKTMTGSIHATEDR